MMNNIENQFMKRKEIQQKIKRKQRIQNKLKVQNNLIVKMTYNYYLIEIIIKIKDNHNYQILVIQ